MSNRTRTELRVHKTLIVQLVFFKNNLISYETTYHLCIGVVIPRISAILLSARATINVDLNIVLIGNPSWIT